MDIHERLVNSLLVVFTLSIYPLSIYLTTQESFAFVTDHFEGKCLDSARSIVHFGGVLAFILPIFWQFAMK